MGLLETVVERLMLAQETLPRVKASAVDADRHGVKKSRKVLTVERHVSDPTSRDVEQTSRRIVARAETDRGGASSPDSGQIVDRAWFRREMRMDPSVSVDSLAAEVVTPVEQESQIQSHQTMRMSRDLRRYAIGGGELGQMGVTPVEMASAPRSAAGARARLVAAIDDYLSDGMTKHTAGLLRQGITSR